MTVLYLHLFILSSKLRKFMVLISFSVKNNTRIWSRNVLMLGTYILMPYYRFWFFLLTFMKSFYFWSQWFLLWYGLFEFGSLWDFDWLFRFYFVRLYFSHGSVNWLLFFSSILLFSVWLHWPKFDIIFFSDNDMFYLLRLTFPHILDCLYLDTGGIISVLALTDLLSNVNKV